MATIQNNLQAVKNRIAAACKASGRPEATVRLVAVGKTFSAEAIREAAGAGQRDFGENYVQEALAKIEALADLPLVWHFIGPIQSNKTRAIAEAFHWVHSLDREKIARRLSEARPAHLPPLKVCIEVNVSGEASKGGVAPQAVAALARQVSALPRLELRGLMAIPEPTPDAQLQRRRFRALRELKDELVSSGLALDTLSMGMSADLEAAIAEGSTMVRVGTAIFGERGHA
jgi:pyridoxal phosphate enzyme (YggS family)